MITTAQAGVGEGIANTPTCAITKDVAKDTQYSSAPKAQVVGFQTPTQPYQPPIKKGTGQTNQNLPTPVHPLKLWDYLHGYDPKLRLYLFHGFTYGFSLKNTQSFPQSPPKNLKSAYQLPHVVQAKLNKESSMGRIAGPFQKQPFDQMVFSPLGLQPKKVPGEYRVIHHLSFPRGQSVNDGISFEDATVKYASVGQAIHQIVNIGPQCYMAKTDIQSAFRIVPVSPENYPLLGFKWEGAFYYDKCLPMGCASSCSIFETLSTALEWIISNKLPQDSVLHILDDFLFISPTPQACQEALDLFILICQDIGVPLAPDKTVGPDRVLDFAGIRLDTINMTASLPPDKVAKFTAAIDSMLSSKSVQLKQIQVLAGMLNFSCSVIAPARAFSRRLYNLSIGLSKPYHHRKITNQVRADLHVWKNFLQSYNRLTFFLDFNFLSQDLLQLYTDSSTTIGYGGYFGDKWFFGSWSDTAKSFNIALLEIYPICLAIKLWGGQLTNKCLQINSDNMAVVHILNNSTSKDHNIMAILRIIVLDCMKLNIMIRSSHISGRSNICSDLLSRGQVDKAKRLYPHLQPNPVETPQEWTLDQLLKI